jgi:hypothetical protein
VQSTNIRRLFQKQSGSVNCVSSVAAMWCVASFGLSACSDASVVLDDASPGSPTVDVRDPSDGPLSRDALSTNVTPSDITPWPDVVVLPDVSSRPDVVVPPDVTPRPDVVVLPDVVVPLDVTPRPDVVAPLDVTPRPDVVASLDVTPRPDVVAPLDVTPRPDVVTPPDVTPPDVTPRPDVVTPPDAGTIARCGDGTCATSEHCHTCPSDCRTCVGTAPTITRGPYLQNASGEAVTVRWRTSTATDSVVAYGSSPSALTRIERIAGARTEHIVRLIGLSPDTRYHYAIGATGAPLRGGDAVHYVVTAPTTARATRVWVIGDAGTANADQRAVRDAYDRFSTTRTTDLWLMLGDNAYTDGTDAQYQTAVFDMYPNTLRHTVLWPTLGNHDGRSADSATQRGPYYDMFSLPTAGEAGGVPSGTEAYYAFDYGNIHFVCLDSHDLSRATSGPMLTWLRNDLAATTKEWIIAFFHHPPYSKGTHDSDTEPEMREMRENALPVLESFGVDLVLGGHSHTYERTFYLNGHYGLSSTLTPAMVLNRGNGRVGGGGAYTRATTTNRGAVYVVAGSSGQAEAAPLNHPAMFVSLSRLGSLVVDVDGNRLDATFVDSTATVVDTFTIRHP